MTKRLLLPLILCFAALTPLPSQYSLPSTGILPFQASDDWGKKNRETVTSELTTALGSYRFLKLVERSRMKEVMDEIGLGMAGVVDDRTAVKAGKIHGLQIMITGTAGRKRISARAVHMETQRVIASATVEGLDKISLLGRSLAGGIEVFMARENLKSLRNDSPDITLDFWAEKSGRNARVNRLRVGDSAVFHVRSNRDGYLTIVDIQPGGDVVILYPNDYVKTNRIQAGKLYSIPSPGDPFQILVSEPAGADVLVAFFTEKPVDWLDRSKLSGEGFWSVKENQKLELTRGFKVTSTKLNSRQWESKSLEIEVVK